MKIEQSGFFWLPEKSSEKIAGKLMVEDNGRVNIELYGIFKIWKKRDPNESIECSRINGTIYDYNSKSKTEVALFDCILTHTTESLIAKNEYDIGDRVSLYAHRLIIGTEYCDNGEDILINKINFSFDGIEQWIGKYGVKTEYNEDAKIYSYSYGIIAEEEVLYKGDAEFSNRDEQKINTSINMFILHSKLVSSNFKGVSIKTTPTIIIEFADMVPITMVESLLNELMVFFSFATNGTPTMCDVVASSSTDGEKKESREMEMYFMGRIFSGSLNNSRIMLFRAKDIAKHNMLKEWFDMHADNRKAFRAYALYKADNKGKLIDDFLDITQAIEILHRVKFGNTHSKRCAKDSNFRCGTTKFKCECNCKCEVSLSDTPTSLRCRIEYLIEEFSDLIVGYNEGIARKIAETRDFHIHGSEENRKNHLEMPFGTGKLKNQDVRDLLERIFQLFFLKEVGCPDSKIKDIFKKK